MMNTAYGSKLDTAAVATVVYADGACSGNPGPGGWGWWVNDDLCGSGPLSGSTTNNIAELTAVLEALRNLEGPVELRIDSAYVIGCLSTWTAGWVRRGWVTAAGGPVANRAIIEEILQLCLKRHVVFAKVKGHSGDPGNESADRLAVAASKQAA